MKIKFIFYKNRKSETVLNFSVYNSSDDNDQLSDK